MASGSAAKSKPCEHGHIAARMTCIGELAYVCGKCGEWEFES